MWHGLGYRRYRGTGHHRLKVAQASRGWRLQAGEVLIISCDSVCDSNNCPVSEAACSEDSAHKQQGSRAISFQIVADPQTAASLKKDLASSSGAAQIASRCAPQLSSLYNASKFLL